MASRLKNKTNKKNPTGTEGMNACIQMTLNKMHA